MLALVLAVASVSFTSCDSAEKAKKAAEEAAAKTADSLAKVAAEAQRVADSLAALPKSIAATAAGNPALGTLVSALGAAGLTSVFEGTTAYTVFAPTNDAFSAVQKTVDMLLKPDNKGKLTNVLKYHVVEGTFKAADLKDGQKLKTLQGEELTVKMKDGKVMINDAEVTSADVAVSNGVVHVISKVVVPKKM
ncbi:MAG: fasciclin domain-containing protein [Bernardetiaceae bacterium]|nr:fasciclin domain-containing protein [Bernardetiaceae bacterium]